MTSPGSSFPQIRLSSPASGTGLDWPGSAHTGFRPAQPCRDTQIPAHLRCVSRRGICGDGGRAGAGEDKCPRERGGVGAEITGLQASWMHYSSAHPSTRSLGAGRGLPRGDPPASPNARQPAAPPPPAPRCASAQRCQASCPEDLQSLSHHLPPPNFPWFKPETVCFFNIYCASIPCRPQMCLTFCRGGGKFSRAAGEEIAEAGQCGWDTMWVN